MRIHIELDIDETAWIKKRLEHTGHAVTGELVEHINNTLAPAILAATYNLGSFLTQIEPVRDWRHNQNLYAALERAATLAADIGYCAEGDPAALTQAIDAARKAVPGDVQTLRTHINDLDTELDELSLDNMRFRDENTKLRQELDEARTTIRAWVCDTPNTTQEEQ